ncbi:hypothetical protein CON64_10930 [Bacillus pseudomycoides]|nr:hypothetical protein CON64_10930 [Bacillus pseudomycoides]
MLDKFILMFPLFETSHVAGKGPDRIYAWPDALVLPKKKVFFNLYIGKKRIVSLTNYPFRFRKLLL